MQSSKPAQAGIMVAANYAKNSGCWPIIAPFRQTRRVITCQVLKINTVLVKYLGLHVPCKYRGPRGYSHMWAIILLPWVPEAFHARFPVSASSESNGHESVALGEKARRKYLKTFVAPFLLTRLTAPGSSTPRMPFRSSRSMTCRPVADEAPHHMREKRTSGTLGLGTIIFTFVETLVTLRPLRLDVDSRITHLQISYANLNIGKGEDKQTRGKVSWLRRQNPQFSPVQTDATLLHVPLRPFAHPVTCLWGVCCPKFETGQTFDPQLPPKRSTAMLDLFGSSSNITLLGPHTRFSHGLRGVYKVMCEKVIIFFPLLAMCSRCDP